ncbi:hypothetical protein B0H13DRAFT_2316204 [Mycena leptocephala]|nr:hypothetical protein B0H13DRAFT_2316204 [Mycena leptocephala]
MSARTTDRVVTRDVPIHPGQFVISSPLPATLVAHSSLLHGAALFLYRGTFATYTHIIMLCPRAFAYYFLRTFDQLFCALAPIMYKPR